ncbi:MAG: hypothetical protein ACREMQ_23630 [Longimicrobiales bacterium]
MAVRIARRTVAIGLRPPTEGADGPPREGLLVIRRQTGEERIEGDGITFHCGKLEQVETGFCITGIIGEKSRELGGCIARELATHRIVVQQHLAQHRACFGVIFTLGEDGRESRFRLLGIALEKLLPRVQQLKTTPREPAARVPARVPRCLASSLEVITPFRRSGEAVVSEGERRIRADREPKLARRIIVARDAERFLAREIGFDRYGRFRHRESKPAQIILVPADARGEKICGEPRDEIHQRIGRSLDRNHELILLGLPGLVEIGRQTNPSRSVPDDVAQQKLLSAEATRSLTAGA